MADRLAEAPPTPAERRDPVGHGAAARRSAPAVWWLTLVALLAAVVLSSGIGATSATGSSADGETPAGSAALSAVDRRANVLSTPTVITGLPAGAWVTVRQFSAPSSGGAPAGQTQETPTPAGTPTPGGARPAGLPNGATLTIVTRTPVAAASLVSPPSVAAGPAAPAATPIISISSSCDGGGNSSFIITNIGGDMTGSGTWQLFQNGIFLTNGSFQLKAGENTQLGINGLYGTLRVDTSGGGAAPATASTYCVTPTPTQTRTPTPVPAISITSSCDGGGNSSFIITNIGTDMKSPGTWALFQNGVFLTNGAFQLKAGENTQLSANGLYGTLRVDTSGGGAAPATASTFCATPTPTPTRTPTSTPTGVPADVTVTAACTQDGHASFLIKNVGAAMIGNANWEVRLDGTPIDHGVFRLNANESTTVREVGRFGTLTFYVNGTLAATTVCQAPTATATITSTLTATSTSTATSTTTPTFTVTPTATPTLTVTATGPPTLTGTPTSTPASTPTPTTTLTPIIPPTPTPTPPPGRQATSTVTATQTVAATATSGGPGGQASTPTATPPGTPGPGPSQLGNLRFVTPVRVLDTRPATQNGTGPIGFQANGSPVQVGQLPAGATSRFLLAGKTFGAGSGTVTVPADATGVLINVTLSQAQASGGFVTVYPGDAASAPNASTLNPSTAIAANFWATGLAPAGGVNAGTIAVTSIGADRDLAIDLVGYYSPSNPAGALGPGHLKFVQPVRVLDTRPAAANGTGPIGFDASGQPVPAAPLLAGATRGFSLAGQTFGSGAGAVTFPPDVAGIVAHVTIVQAQASGGFVTLLPGGSSGTPGTSTVNPSTAIAFNAWQVGVPPPGQAGAGQFSLFSTNTLDAIVDVVGYYAPSNTPGQAGVVGNLTFVQPARVLDTRAAPFGPIGFQPGGGPIVAGPLVPGTTTRYLLDGRSFAGGTVTLPADAKGVLANVTLVQSQAGGGFVTVFPGDAATAPNTSTVNPSTGIAASFWPSGVPLAPSANPGTLGVTSIGDSRDLLIDVVGYFR